MQILYSRTHVSVMYEFFKQHPHADRAIQEVVKEFGLSPSVCYLERKDDHWSFMLRSREVLTDAQVQTLRANLEISLLKLPADLKITTASSVDIWFRI